ncbi:hypothetical protein NGA_0023802 [Nannochloropsis gaditana CCMP526]|uniref:Uncharacterized protein n=1 Tax=Nannochloropsis gaditana TaxID=72520 RepID=W7TBA7_9STRA|nr:hypothetical protein NGA_0023802 [Nannochloropsis gaditana CCMP526]EKU22118.1 hypothetical protein NGA_0023802 [Nannochloropsis gaditana CCMP526]EWM23492.1 hypothetical protein Naga_100198g7 [Nannochloropsis gaditana]|eukprot:XP_005854238.1 hypothetical protein NGA_0023802 [Nannochloropsis gaditana CCMP526]
MLHFFSLFVILALTVPQGLAQTLANNGSMTLLRDLKVNKRRVRCGRNLAVIGRVRLNSFGDADSLYCALRNMNYDSAQFDLKDRVTRFTHINTRKFVMMFGDETPSDGTKKYWWSWSRDGRLFSEGLKYSLRVNLILRNATATPVTWRFYCETKKNNFTSHYFWDKTGADVNKQVRVAAPCEYTSKKDKL